VRLGASIPARGMVRVVLLERSRIVADLVREVVSQHDDVEVVASVTDARGLQSVVESGEVDLVITTFSPTEPELRRLDLVLVARPGLRVLAVEDDGRRASMYALVPQMTRLGPLSPQTLIDFIRSAPRPVEGELAG
jgi:DNA-binding NarL/FixJ family response regulator